MASNRAPAPAPAPAKKTAKKAAKKAAVKRGVPKVAGVVVAAQKPRRAMDELLVRRAMQELRTEAHSGPKLAAWAVEDAELYDAAKRYLLDGETQEEVVAEAMPDLVAAKVSGRALITWLTKLKRRFREVSLAVIDRQLDSGEAAMLGVEQADQQHILQTAVNAKVVKALAEIDLVGGDVERIQALTRMLEHGANVAKVRADAALRAQQAALAEARAAKIQESMRAVADDLERSAAGAAPTYTPEQIAQMIRVAAMGGDVKAHADRLAAAPEGREAAA